MPVCALFNVKTLNAVPVKQNALADFSVKLGSVNRHLTRYCNLLLSAGWPSLYRVNSQLKDVWGHADSRLFALYTLLLGNVAKCALRCLLGTISLATHSARQPFFCFCLAINSMPSPRAAYGWRLSRHFSN